MRSLTAEFLCCQRFIPHGTLLPVLRLLSPFQLRPSRFSGLYIGKISSFGNSAPLFFTVLCSVVTGHVEVGHLWFVERLLFYSLVYALFWFVVRKPMRVQSGVNVVWIVFAVIIVSAANYWVRPA